MLAGPRVIPDSRYHQRRTLVSAVPLACDETHSYLWLFSGGLWAVARTVARVKTVAVTPRREWALRFFKWVT